MIRAAAVMILLSGACRTGAKPASGDTGAGSLPTPPGTSSTVDTAGLFACDDPVVPGVVVQGFCVQPEPVDELCPSLNLLPPRHRPAEGCPTFLDVVDGSGFLEGDHGVAWDGNAMLLSRCELRDGTPFDTIYRKTKRLNSGRVMIVAFDPVTGAVVNVHQAAHDSWDEARDGYRRVFCCSGTLAHTMFWGEQQGLCRVGFSYTPEDFAEPAP